MPGRNIYKDYVAESYYHVYNKGIDNQIIFKDSSDYAVFLSLLKRYLGNESAKNSVGVEYANFADQVEVLAFCLMPNHFHLLIYQSSAEGMKLLLKSVSVAYGMYFNKKYKRRGPVFQQRYRAVMIDKDDYLLHISRYIHINPDNYLVWEWSSLPYYLGKFNADWLRPKKILELFEGDNYSEFIKDYEKRRDELKSLKTILADG
jgi:putative transposase